MAQPSCRPGPGSRRARAWVLRRFRLSRKAAASRSDWSALAGVLEAAVNPRVPDSLGGSGLLDDMAALRTTLSRDWPTS